MGTPTRSSGSLLVCPGCGGETRCRVLDSALGVRERVRRRRRECRDCRARFTTVETVVAGSVEVVGVGAGVGHMAKEEQKAEVAA